MLRFGSRPRYQCFRKFSSSNQEKPDTQLKEPEALSSSNLFQPNLASRKVNIRGFRPGELIINQTTRQLNYKGNAT